MEIEVKLDINTPERKVIIVTEAVDEEIKELMQRINREYPQVLAGFHADTVTVLEQGQIIRVYASGGKVFAVTKDGEYTLRLRLYEMEERLDPSCFVRISNSEIVNLRWVKSFDLSYTGTIRVVLRNGDTAFVSRRYVGKIKKVLGI